MKNAAVSLMTTRRRLQESTNFMLVTQKIPRFFAEMPIYLFIFIFSALISCRKFTLQHGHVCTPWVSSVRELFAVWMAALGGLWVHSKVFCISNSCI